MRVMAQQRGGSRYRPFSASRDVRYDGRFAFDAPHQDHASMATRTLIRDLAPNQFIDAIFMMNNCQQGTTRNGKPFLKCLLSDRSGRLAARMWSCPDDIFSQLPCDGFVWVSAQSQPYQGEMQLIIQNIRTI